MELMVPTVFKPPRMPGWRWLALAALTLLVALAYGLTSAVFVFVLAYQFRALFKFAVGEDGLRVGSVDARPVPWTAIVSAEPCGHGRWAYLRLTTTEPDRDVLVLNYGVLGDTRPFIEEVVRLAGPMHPVSQALVTPEHGVVFTTEGGTRRVSIASAHKLAGQKLVGIAVLGILAAVFFGTLTAVFYDLAQEPLRKRPHKDYAHSAMFGAAALVSLLYPAWRVIRHRRSKST